MTAAEFLVNYVKKWGWLSVANIFHDNGATTQPFTTNGFICASPSAEMLFSTGIIDNINGNVLDMNYLVPPAKVMGYHQTITCFPFDCIQRFDTLLYAYTKEFDPSLIGDSFPIPTRLSPADIEAFDPESTTGTFQVQMDTNENLMVDMFPDLNKPISAITGIRIKKQQEFLANHKKFVTAMNEFFGVSDCL